MVSFRLCVLCIALLVAPPVLAQQTEDPDGQALYAQRCALCHRADGEGVLPAFPALSGNENLAELERIVSNIYIGAGNMPAFPDLTITQVASLASFLRNAWGNAYGAVTPADVASIHDKLQGSGQIVSSWDGVFTEAQANRGRAVYSAPCGWCHGRRLNGAPDDPDAQPSPPLARIKFLRNWYGKSLATLYTYTRATMPESNPGSLTDQEYIDIIAYMLSVSGMPTGSNELPPDAQILARTLIQPKPSGSQ